MIQRIVETGRSLILLLVVIVALSVIFPFLDIRGPFFDVYQSGKRLGIAAITLLLAGFGVGARYLYSRFRSGF